MLKSDPEKQLAVWWKKHNFLKHQTVCNIATDPEKWGVVVKKIHYDTVMYIGLRREMLRGTFGNATYSRTIKKKKITCAEEYYRLSRDILEY